MEIIKTMPENELLATRKALESIGKGLTEAILSADVMRAQAINDLLDIARETGVSAKVAVADIMESVVKPVSLVKNEKGIPPTKVAGKITDYGTTWKLGYSTSRAYAKGMEISFAKGVPFYVSLYKDTLDAEKVQKQADHAAKLLAAETLAAEKAAEAKALASKAARAKATDEVKLAAAQAKLEAEKAQQAVRKAIDAAPISQKTGGRKAAPKSGPVKALTRHEVALHATALVAMLESIGELSVASEVREILADNNLFAE